MAAEERGGGERRVNVSGLTDRLETVGYQHGGGRRSLSCLVAALCIIARITPDRGRETDGQTDRQLAREQEKRGRECSTQLIS